MGRRAHVVRIEALHEFHSFFRLTNLLTQLLVHIRRGIKHLLRHHEPIPVNIQYIIEEGVDFCGRCIAVAVEVEGGENPFNGAGFLRLGRRKENVAFFVLFSFLLFLQLGEKVVNRLVDDFHIRFLLFDFFHLRTPNLILSIPVTLLKPHAKRELALSHTRFSKLQVEVHALAGSKRPTYINIVVNQCSLLQSLSPHQRCFCIR